jgi:cellulose synthase/poly-beta-1,6-N-acetylglucosamine synthase-like glycosyltransferase
MNRLIAIARTIPNHNRVRAFSVQLSAALQDLLPFLFPPPKAMLGPDFKSRTDFLFLPRVCSTRTVIHHETLALVVVLVTGASVLSGIFWLGFGVSPLVAATSLLALFYFGVLVFKLWVVRASLVSSYITVSADALAHLKDAQLPVYTILVPLRDEAEVMRQIVAAMDSIDYPKEKLDLIITVEVFDTATREAIAQANIPPSWRVLVLPDTLPKTKPKALNVAFLEARGEFLAIYDAEIIPDRDQLKKAVIGFAQNPHLAILQTRLDHYNTDQNALTRLFTMEFTFYYDLFLPGLAYLGLPIPLSGHSTHFKMAPLRKVGAWDPYNVAEDCEIGIRLFRAGAKSGVLDSFSKEEAASTLKSWIAQRTRWMKGFIQTSIVHLRYPMRLKEELGGWKNFGVFLLVVPGTVLLNILNLVSWVVFFTWILTGAEAIKSLYPTGVLYLSVFAFVVGSFLFVYLNLVALHRRGKFHILRYWLLVPVYWLLLSIATVRALYQLIYQPHVWEKTTHGTHLVHK